MIPLFIPTKDRACQLDLLLRSIEKNCKIFNPYIIYQSSSQEFENGYQKLNKELIKEQLPLIEEFRAFLLVNQQLGKKLFGITTDDTIFYRKFEYNTKFVEEQFEDENLWCFSLRLGLNVLVQNHRNGQLQPKLEYYEDIQNCIKWFWKAGNPHDNYNYGAGQDASIYRIDDWLEILQNNKFSSLRDLESRMASELRENILREWMISPKESVAVNTPINAMQKPYIENFNNDFSVEKLNEAFLNGYQISLEDIEMEKIVGCHQNVNILLKKVTSSPINDV